MSGCFFGHSIFLDEITASIAHTTTNTRLKSLLLFFFQVAILLLSRRARKRGDDIIVVASLSISTRFVLCFASPCSRLEGKKRSSAVKHFGNHNITLAFEGDAFRAPFEHGRHRAPGLVSASILCRFPGLFPNRKCCPFRAPTPSLTTLCAALPSFLCSACLLCYFFKLHSTRLTQLCYTQKTRTLKKIWDTSAADAAES